jgi:hypothetical protein
MLAIAPTHDPADGANRDDERRLEPHSPVNFPVVSSGDPTFASRADEILRSLDVDARDETP